uniref:Uncharacterized protein n=1 Tax=Rhizophora mucronata TaxID=61149 RepID=A0A2P2IQQ2_RHIMU
MFPTRRANSLTMQASWGRSVAIVCWLGNGSQPVTRSLNQDLEAAVKEAPFSSKGMMRSLTCKVPIVPMAATYMVKFDKKEQ